MENEILKILEYWKDIEYSRPYSLPKKKNDKSIRTIETKEDFMKIKKSVQYGIYLGIFGIDDAIDDLQKSKNIESYWEKTYIPTCICHFKVDSEGSLVDKSFSLSTFPWLLDQVINNYKNISHYDLETSLLERLENYTQLLDYDCLLDFKNYLSKQFKWKIPYKKYWMQIKSGESNTASPLNSFFVQDLKHIIYELKHNRKKNSECFISYIRTSFLKKRTIDIENDRAMRFRIMSPKNLPYGRWPSKYGARFMQQLNVNAFLSEDAEIKQPLFSVNGPPGTGKTTLLKDIIAAIITKRAYQLCKLKNPNDMFKKGFTIATFNNGSNQYIHKVRELREHFDNFGILVASSNNGAVENITHTLPSIKDIPECYRKEEYRYFNEISDLIFGKDTTWALNSAALGNKKNRTSFFESFWSNADIDGTFKEKNGWLHAKESFQIKWKRVETEIEELYEVYAYAEEYFKTKKKLDDEYDKLSKIDDMIKLKKENLKSIIFFEKEKQQIRLNIQEYERILKAGEFKMQEFKDQKNSPQILIEYFQLKNKEKSARTSPWGYDKLNKYREELFLEALQLHKVFVESSDFLWENLSAFCKYQKDDKSLVSQNLDIIFPSLLQSFFIMVPVVSTAFASVGSFLRHIPANEIGYLFIDEAGQAAPQSAAGAIWRSKKTIVVGDPMQVEPVVNLQKEIVYFFAKKHDLSSSPFTNHFSNLQSIADMSNSFIGNRKIGDMEIEIGSPLIVHNRCQKRMFNISNEIAYNGKMIYATKDSPESNCIWLNVKGNSTNEQYVPNQSQIVFNKCLEVFAQSSYGEIPSLFVITPFTTISYELKKLLKKRFEDETILEKERINSWVDSNIGTIHTFQGKEADSVILCLGASSDGKNIGAVKWVSNQVNILNVAVTRARNNLYIIGDKDIWWDNDIFKKASKHLVYEDTDLPNSDNIMHGYNP